MGHSAKTRAPGWGAHWGIALFVVVTICCGTDKTSHSRTPGDITLLTDLPRGGDYTDPQGKSVEYRIFRIHVINDSTVPVELAMDLPGRPIALLPDTDKYFSAFLFPDEITPDTAQDLADFGITGSVAYLTQASGTTSRSTTILPGEEHLLYIGVIFELQGLNGPGRAELFFKGQQPQASYFPEGSIPTGIEEGNERDLVFGIAIDPPEHYSMVHCGRITFKK